MVDDLEHLLDVPPAERHAVEISAYLAEQRLDLDVVRVSGAEIVDIAVEYLPALERVLDVRTALAPLEHDEEIRLGQILDQRPVIRVARRDDERVDQIGVELLENAVRELHVDERL